MQDRTHAGEAPEAGSLRALFETMPVGVVLQDRDGRITSANPAAERILGLSLDQLQGRTSVDPRWHAVRADGSEFPGDEHPAMVALRTGARVGGVVMGVGDPATGLRHWIRVDATPLFDPGAGAPREVCTTFLDITPEVEVRAAQAADEARFERLFGAMNEGVAYCRMLYDADGRPDDFVYESVNPAFARLTGLADVEGRRVTEVIPTIKSETPELLETYGHVAATGEPAEFDIDFTPLDIYLHIKVFRPEPDHFVAVFENVSEARRATAALRRSQNELSTLIDTIPEITFAIDRDYRLVTANAAFTAATVAAQGRPIARGDVVLAPEYPREFNELWRGHYDRALAGEAFVVETTVPMDDGAHAMENHLSPMRDDQGGVAGVVVLSRDVTERRRALEPLRASEQRLRDIMDAMRVGCQILDGEGRYVYLNPAAEQHARRPRAELIGRRQEDAYPGIEDTEVYRQIKACLARGTTERMENRFVYPDGTVGWYDLVIQPVPEGVLVQSLDITDRVEAEAALRESEATRVTAESIALVGSWRYDPATDLAAWSPGMFEIFGVERTADASGWAIVDFGPIMATRVHPDDRAGIAEATARVLEGGGPGVVEFRLAWPDGSWHVLYGEGTAERAPSGEVVAVSGYYRDVTAQRGAEAEIRALNEDLERRVAERTEELEQATRELQGFVYSISHDLRTPLRTIGSYSQILLHDHAAELGDDAADALRRIDRANGRMVRLVDGLLELAGLARSKLQPRSVDVSRLAREVAGELRDVEPGREVELTIAEGLTAQGDEALLRVVFYDLLGNAWKFTAGRRPAHVEVGARLVEGETAFFVRDDGAGFDPRFVDKLFTPFERLHDDTEFTGTGIGLATVRRIVERHGGRVWAEGEPGAGATFFFTLP